MRILLNQVLNPIIARGALALGTWLAALGAPEGDVEKIVVGLTALLWLAIDTALDKRREKKNRHVHQTGDIFQSDLEGRN